MTRARTSLLLVEDDEDFGKVLQQFIELSGLEVRRVSRGRDALDACKLKTFDLCLLDIGLPDMDGFALAQAMKANGHRTPFIFLTARILKPDRMRGLALGADDYITKPFEADELLLRIHNILRRSGRILEAAVSLGAYTFQPDTRLLSLGDSVQSLSHKEAELLSLLYEHRNRLVKRSEILTRIWGENDYFHGRSMDVFITRLRKLLAADNRIAIEGVRGSGFVLRTPE